MRVAAAFFLSAFSLAAAGPAAAQPVDRAAINRIVDEGLNRSEVMETAAYLTDRIGGRMTNSPQMRAAERWTQQRFRDWGLANVRAEGFEFGRGWSIEAHSSRMTAPRPIALRSIPVAWTPPTQGTISAGIIVAPMAETGDFARWRGRLRGKIVLVSRPTPGSEPADPAFRRLTDEQLRLLNTYQQPNYSPLEIERTLERADFAERLDAFLAEEGALAWVRMSYRDGGLVHGNGYSYRAGRTPRLPGVEMAAEDYRRLARLAATDAPPTLEIVSDVRFHDEDVNAYNIIAEIPGSDAERRLRHGRRPSRQLGRRRRRRRQCRGLRGGDGGGAHPAPHRRPAAPDDPLRFVERRGAGPARLARLCRAPPRHPAAGDRSGAAAPAPEPDLALPLAGHPAARASRPRRLFQPRQRLGPDPRHACRGQYRGGADLPGMARALRLDGRDHGGHRVDRRHRPCLHAVGRHSGLSSSSRIRSIMAAGSTIRASTATIISRPRTCARPR